MPPKKPEKKVQVRNPAQFFKDNRAIAGVCRQVFACPARH